MAEEMGDASAFLLRLRDLLRFFLVTDRRSRDPPLISSFLALIFGLAPEIGVEDDSAAMMP